MEFGNTIHRRKITRIHERRTCTVFENPPKRIDF